MTEFETGEIIGLFIILLVIFILPFLVKKIEEDLEIFLFALGIIAVTITQQWSLILISEAFIEPIIITLAVFIVGILFKFLQGPLARNVNRFVNKVGLKSFIFLIIVVLGLLSSIITAIIAALILVLIVNALNLDRKNEINLVVLACFSIGLGAVLTPVGEPLSTIIITKLKGEPYHAGFWFLFDNLWLYILPLIIFIGIISIKLVGETQEENREHREKKEENLKGILLRTGKIYLFIMALVFLGMGFKPLIESYISNIPYYSLYWMNILAAVLDNATFAAAEIGPVLSLAQIEAALLGLVIAGGMLILGNIPNIIAANKLKIKSKEWAKVGVPLCLSIMLFYFILILV
jgi:predicted cation transporter